MNADLVKAARWLGGSILLASTIVAGSICWVHRDRPIASPAVTLKENSKPAEPVKKDEQVASAGLEIDVPYPDQPRIPIVDQQDVGPDRAYCMDPPSEAEVWDKVSKLKNGSPVFYETQRNSVRILVEKIGEKVDPCKVYPLAGACQLVHCHYKCSVYFDESSRSDSPIPIIHGKARVEVVYIDKDQLRRCGGAEVTTASP